jgi:hypothetical protein
MHAGMGREASSAGSSGDELLEGEDPKEMQART